jgi:hypothetical protein
VLDLAPRHPPAGAFRFPVHQPLGDHELGASDPPPYDDVFGRASYSFTFGDAAFTFLDSASATIDPRVDAWLDGWLATSPSSASISTTDPAREERYAFTFFISGS